VNIATAKWSRRPEPFRQDTGYKGISNAAVKCAGTYSSREQRARDAIQALHEYESTMGAVQEKTKRLRAVRLAKAAANSPSRIA
jgi:hypothetical protein